MSTKPACERFDRIERDITILKWELAGLIVLQLGLLWMTVLVYLKLSDLALQVEGAGAMIDVEKMRADMKGEARRFAMQVCIGLIAAVGVGIGIGYLVWAPG